MIEPAAATRYPGYDVLAKRDTPSWDDITRQVVDERLALKDEPHFFDAGQWRTASALCNRIIVQREDARRVPLAAMLDAQLQSNSGDGYRNARLPPLRQAWERGLAALDAESIRRAGSPFAELDGPMQIELLKCMQHGELDDPAWSGMPCEVFFSERVLHDICGAYYSHPFSWSEIGFGGPANPRGYVRVDFDRRDPWEAVEATTEDREKVRRANRDVG